MTAHQSRPKRWEAAIAKARGGMAQIEEAFGELGELRDEYQDWRDNLPENLDYSPVAEKLDAIIEIDFDDFENPGDALDEAEGADLPRGFGRD